MVGRVRLRSGSSLAEISCEGAEIQHWEVAGEPLLWQPDPAVWAETAPVLFPVVGWTRNGKVRVADQFYPLGLHGFARHKRFRVARLTDDFVRYVLDSDQETLALYPFPFRFCVDYRLDGPALNVSLGVFNRGMEPMPYACGLHPGFRWPLSGESQSGHQIVFDAEEKPFVPEIAPGGLFAARQRPVPLQGTRLDLSAELLKQEALCFLDVKSAGLRYVAEDGAALRIEMTDFPHVALWSRPQDHDDFGLNQSKIMNVIDSHKLERDVADKSTQSAKLDCTEKPVPTFSHPAPASFLAIETWTGHGDPEGFEGDLFTKPSMRVLPPGAEARHGVRFSFSPADSQSELERGIKLDLAVPAKSDTEEETNHGCVTANRERNGLSTAANMQMVDASDGILRPSAGKALIIDGKRVSEIVLAETAEKVRALATSGLKPGLAVVLAGNDPASQVYVRSKGKAAEACGFYSVQHNLPATVSELEVLKLVEELNDDPSIHGILVQLPLPKGIDSNRVLNAISPAKDVDGFHPVNVGLLAIGETAKALVPCTPAGSMVLVERAAAALGFEVSGCNAVVLGRSNIVGKPMAQLLLAQNATVTIAHSKTRDLADVVGRADLLVAAVGRPLMVPGSWIKEGALVIDVGINRIPGEGVDANGKPKTRLVGDVNFEESLARAGAVTPVPGGVGPMTIAMLMSNTLKAALRIPRRADPLTDATFGGS